MEDKNPQSMEEEDAEDALSLCNLQLNNEELESDEYEKNPNPSFDQELFEFLGTDTDTRASSDHETNSEKQIVFGKLISYEEEDDHNLISESFDATHSTSFRFSIPKPTPARPADSCQYSSTSVRSHKHNFFFVPEKFRPDMDLNDIKKRQSRRPPAPLFPTVDGTSVEGEKRVKWGLIGLVKTRHSGRASAKASTDCIPHV